VVQEFRLQDPGEAIHEAEIQEVLVSPGDRVEEGQTVFVIETDKAAVEIPVPFSGTVADIPVKPGDMVRVGELLMTVEEEGAAAAEAETVSHVYQRLGCRPQCGKCVPLVLRLLRVADRLDDAPHPLPAE